jgi:hypothetical protein
MVYPDQALTIALATNLSQTPGDVLTPSEGIANAFSSNGG